MIKQAQTKFIIICMSILLAVFLALYGCIYNIIRTQNMRYIDRELDAISIAYTETVNNKQDSNKLVDGRLIFIVDITNNTKIYDDTKYDEVFIDSITDIAVNSNTHFSNYGNIYYKVYKSDTSSLLIASDNTVNLLDLQKLSVNIVWPMLILYILSSLCVYLFSFRTFKPIKETLRKQRRFISDASHELKTPTTIIAANAEVLKEINDNKWVENIKSQTERLNSLIADMLALARMDEEKLKLFKENIDVSQTITDIALSFDALAFERKKHLVLDIDENIHVIGDTASLKKIAVILLDNAVKHAEEEGEIKVAVKSIDGKTNFSVYNTGSFIPDNQSEKIFERFYRADDSRNREYGGSGLGLSIAKSIANANKWKISAKSKLYESMEITLTF